MPLRFVLDENQRGLLWRAVVRHNQSSAYPLDTVRVGDPPDLPLGAIDLADHLRAGHHSPGIFMRRRGSRLSQVVEHLALVAYASDDWEWQDRIEFIPY
jgi:hypothetical protein